MSSDLLHLQPFEVLPLWANYLLTVIILLLAVEGGYQLSKRMQHRRPDRAEASVGTLNGATLALLAFLLAFVTNNAVNTFSDRRQAVVTEANAIGTTYLRLNFLPEPYDGAQPGHREQGQGVHRGRTGSPAGREYYE